VIAWAVRKARRAAPRLDSEVDAVIDASLDQLHTAVAAKLGAHPVLQDLDQEAEEAASGEGQVSELTRQQVELAVTAAARKDDQFAQTVTDLVAQVRAAENAGGTSVVAAAGSRVFTGDAHAQASGNGIAIGQVAGDVHVDHANGAGQNPDPTPPGRSCP
jgi:hypothetical protein